MRNCIIAAPSAVCSPLSVKCTNTGVLVDWIDLFCEDAGCGDGDGDEGVGGLAKPFEARTFCCFYGFSLMEYIYTEWRIL